MLFCCVCGPSVGSRDLPLSLLEGQFRVGSVLGCEVFCVFVCFGLLTSVCGFIVMGCLFMHLLITLICPVILWCNYCSDVIFVLFFASFGLDYLVLLLRFLVMILVCLLPSYCNLVAH